MSDSGQRVGDDEEWRLRLYLGLMDGWMDVCMYLWNSNSNSKLDVTIYIPKLSSILYHVSQQNQAMQADLGLEYIHQPPYPSREYALLSALNAGLKSTT